jgi:hypothetical protein
MRLVEIEDVVKAGRDDPAIKAAINFAVAKYRSTGAVIYKGSDRYGAEEDVFFRDPTAHAMPRISANTKNYTTLWVDNSPAWSQFPPRSRSLICSTDARTAGGYGDVAVVIPLSDTKIGVCSAPDYWDSFKETMPSNIGINELNLFIDRAIRNQTDKRLNQKTLTYPVLVDIFSKLSPDLGTLRSDAGFAALIRQQGWKGMMDHVLDPKANGFATTSWRQFNIRGDREVWLSAPCVMINYVAFLDLVK